MLGISDFWIASAYLLSILSSIGCAVFGILNWNKGLEHEEDEIKEEAKWEKEEMEIEDEILGKGGLS